MSHLQRATALWASLVALSWSVAGNPIVSTNTAPAQIDLRSGTPSDQHKSSLPAVWPPPQEISVSAGACAVRLNGAVTIVTGNATDAPAIEAVKAIVAGAGGTATVSPRASVKGTQIYLGTDADADAAAAAKALTGDSAGSLAAEGYVLGVGKYDGRPAVVLNGVDARGTYYAAQTLRQLVGDARGVPGGVKIRDWPLMPIRGSIEGFYGIPWSHQARKDQLAFYGRRKMNTYVYTPKGDPYLRATWRDLYGGADLDNLRDLVQTANANHVDFTYALSPGLDLCYTSDADFNATVAKFEQLRALGVSSFYVALDDISLKFHCDSDTAKFPNKGDWHWIADAQAFYLNRVQKEYIKAHEGLADLQTVPTNYAGSAPDPYKGEFGKQLDKNIRVQWTGEGVFSDEITVESVVRAGATYVTDKLFIWDNFPVNDNKPTRLFLNPLTGRAPDLYKHMIGFTSNPMVQSYASMIALGNYGDYAWNGPAYAAQDSWAAVVRELAGDDGKVREALAAFADINQNWPYRNSTESAPKLSAAIAAFWAARRSGGSGGKQGGGALESRLELIAGVPDALPGMAMKPFAPEVAPWTAVAMQWAKASQHALTMLAAVDAGDKDRADEEFKAVQAWVDKTKAKTVSSLGDDGKVVPNSITPTTGDGVFDAFIANATAIYKGQ
ncbi:Beta-N-acetylglucosaminidase [Cordyceps fumosorosea ARSEF 2679]|uniref:Beta-N-acetylglucosaminidase n=1 Tax=Cordyceps fumosorosea (strain ARSEF 2679) TaxID=1081104 RepID=A0A168EQ54_CORFA|nr:Beta-N-acetylglucosaminidase [Cordyceps fumosorosea ARSEF 2679]OAA74088.1 Beta-N-acetylglucosaminidase [Cordyceps fumosorosea ARSEF 2679]